MSASDQITSALDTHFDVSDATRQADSAALRIAGEPVAVGRKVLLV
jgi:hypothetical protein